MERKPPSRPVLGALLLIVVVAVCLMRPVAGTSAPPQHPLAGVEVVAQGFKNPIGVAVNRDGSIVVSDKKAGTITQIAPDGQQMVLVGGLEGPAGVAFDLDGGLLIVEERERRILRRDPSGSLAVLASGIVSPRWIAISPDGAIYISAKQVVPVMKSRGTRDEDDDDHGSSRRILEPLPSGALRTVEDGFQGLEDGQAFSYPVVFVADTDGRWRLWQF